MLKLLPFIFLLIFSSAVFADTPMGWDYDLTRRCAKTPDPSSANYYQDVAQCLNDKKAKQWTLAVQSEPSAALSCPGPINQSFLINGVNSPVTLGWQTHQSELASNWTVNMKVDHVTHSHPCGQGYFTFFGFMNHVDLHGGPLPAPLQLSASHTVFYDHYVPNGDNAARLIVGAQGWWGGKAHVIEVNLASANWGDAHRGPIAILVAPNWTPDMEFVVLDGSALGLSVSTGTAAWVSIDWAELFSLAIQNGWFAPLNSQPSVTQAVYIGVEVKNTAIGNLWQTDFRISQQ